jgi:hypothetical protein
LRQAMFPPRRLTRLIVTRKHIPAIRQRKPRILPLARARSVVGRGRSWERLRHRLGIAIGPTTTSRAFRVGRGVVAVKSPSRMLAGRGRPVARAYVGSGMIMTGSGRQPACRHLDAVLAQARFPRGPVTPLADEFAAIEPGLKWSTRTGARGVRRVLPEWPRKRDDCWPGGSRCAARCLDRCKCDGTAYAISRPQPPSQGGVCSAFARRMASGEWSVVGARQ